MRISRKKLVIGAAAAAGVLGVSVGALAFWTSTGTGTGSASTGTSTAWDVTTETDGGPLYPGTGVQTVTYTVTNNGAGQQGLNAVAVTVDSNVDGDVLSTASGNPPVVGCKAAWFTVTDSTFFVQDLAPLGQYVNDSTIVLDNEPLNQDACKSATFKVTASAS